ncbi:MAG: hypothetical protein K6G49_02060 [Candidatus Saccharibacteria bacterium]|nr:hypothetical protein [Candidatus Saccharibacteria bacterium]
MNTTYLKKFGVKATGTAPYDGWTGNQNQNLYGKELTQAIRQDLQKVLCEGERPLKKSGISVRKGRGGYTTSLYITVKADRHSDIIATDEEIRGRVIDSMRHGRRNWVGATFGIYWEDYRSRPDEEQRQIENETADAVLASIKGDVNISSYHIDKEEILSDFGKQVFKACKQVVNAYNSDHSDIMTDYFDRGIYDNYGLRVV